MKIVEDIKKLFELCSTKTTLNLKDNYMYMYSREYNSFDTHYFKNIKTRKEIAIREIK